MKTKKPMKYVSARIKEAQLRMLQLAATKLDQSQSEIVREAIREKTAKILLDADTQERVTAS
jgi:uncharacterized protein (DUF1778 family)